MFTKQTRLYGRFSPAFFWYPLTNGITACNPYTGTFGRGVVVYGPYGGAGGFAAYNPRTGTYVRGGAVYGPYGSGGFAEAWNPRAFATTRRGRNVAGDGPPRIVVAAGDRRRPGGQGVR